MPSQHDSESPKTSTSKGKAKWAFPSPERLSLSAISPRQSTPIRKLDPDVLANLTGDTSWISAFDSSSPTPTSSLSSHQESSASAAGPFRLRRAPANTSSPTED
ncbi:hypothetical protein Moror_8573, partial [Moniliophthora roreri MCA 2997]